MLFALFILAVVAVHGRSGRSEFPVETDVDVHVRPPTWGILQELGSATEMGHVKERAIEATEFMVKVRRELHQVPELLYDLPETTKIVKRVLAELGIPFQSEVGTYGHMGIVATIGTGKEPVVALRTDMDGLPILEAVESPYKSKHIGKMHACGHDAHMAMLLGAAKILKIIEAQLKGTVLLVFQPAEEGGAGMHVWPTLPSGVIASREGGHAAMPHQTVDPVMIATLAVVNIQTIISRELSPVESGVISVTRIIGGDAFNVIPTNATIGGTIRSFTVAGFKRLEKRLIEIVGGVAAAHNAQAIVTRITSHDESACLHMQNCAFPPVVNSKQTHEFAMAQARLLVGENKVIPDVEPSMTGEDFAYYSHAVPSSFVWLGSGDNNSTGLHTPTFTLDEQVLPIGAALHVSLAYNTLASITANVPVLTPGEVYIDKK